MTGDPVDEALRTYQRATTPDELAARRIRLAVRSGVRRGAPRWALIPALGATLAAIGVAAVLLSRSTEPAPATLPLPHVALEPAAGLQLEGTLTEPVVWWEDGRLAVEVEPHQGVALTVRTPEATVRVVGTAFTVERARHATTVGVTEGVVSVTCAGDSEERVAAGATRTCLPTDPHELVLRLAELYPGGSPAERQASAEAALRAMPASSPLRAEALAHLTRALADGGQVEAAVEAAEAALALPDRGRRAELLSFVARTRYGREACGAAPALERAVVELPPGPEHLLLASCLAGSDPARARELVGDGAWATGEWAGVVQELRARLGQR